MSGIEIYMWQERSERHKPDWLQYFRRVKLTAKGDSGYPVYLSESGDEFYAPKIRDVPTVKYDQRNGLLYESDGRKTFECHLSKKKEEVWGGKNDWPMEQLNLWVPACLLSGAGGTGADLIGFYNDGIKVYGEPVKSHFGVGRSSAKNTWYPLVSFLPKGMKVLDTDFFWASNQGKAVIWVCVLCGNSDNDPGEKRRLLSVPLDSLVPGVLPSVPGLPPFLSVPDDVQHVAVDPDAAYVWMTGWGQAIYRLHLKSGDAVESFSVDSAPGGINFWIEDKDHAWVVVACTSGNIPLLPVHGSVNAQHPVIKGEPLPKRRPLGFGGVAIRESDGRALITWYPYLEGVYIRDVDLKARKVLHHMELPVPEKSENTESGEYFLPGWTP
ncbi:YncE family protein [Streptomyces sp. NPDC050161]|uniref:YncE family protein n=1 Tax=Streptomyces sp. NPDC050161 TaxID=3365604 RepID=UPI0037B8BF9A